MLRNLILFITLLCASVSAFADSPQYQLGLSVLMFMETTIDKQKTNTSDPAYIYFVPPQHNIATNQEGGNRFSTHLQLLSFFQNSQSSIQKNGLWIKRMAAPNLWSSADNDRVAALTREARQRKLLLFICGPVEPKSGKSEVLWDCEKASPFGSHVERNMSLTTPRQNPPAISWSEEVSLRDGRVLPVERTAAFGVDESGKRFSRLSISFNTDDGHVSWKEETKWPITYMPDILDFVDRDPVVVLPVHRFGPCYEYGFPQEGLIAYRYQKGKWSRIDIKELPQTLMVNLLRSTHAIQHWAEYKDKTIDLTAKKTLEKQSWGPKQDTTIADASRFYADLEESCIRMRPLPDAKRDAARERNAEAETHAVTINATLGSVISAPREITGKDYLDAHGIWTGAGYLTGSCGGIIDKLETVREWQGDSNSYRSDLVGYRLVLSSKAAEKIQIDIPMNRALMERIICDEKTIYAIRRLNGDTLIAHRFSHLGGLFDAIKIILPEADKINPSPNWADLWEVELNENKLVIVLANYTYTQLANQGGTVKRKHIYSAKLP